MILPFSSLRDAEKIRAKRLDAEHDDHCDYRADPNLDPRIHLATSLSLVGRETHERAKDTSCYPPPVQGRHAPGALPDTIRLA